MNFQTLPALDFLEDLENQFKEIPAKLVPNFFSFLVQLIALIILILAFVFIAYKPLKEKLNQRGEYIENNINNAKNDAIKAEQNRIQSEEAIIASKKRANEIILEANKEASNIKQKSIEDTQVEISKMKLQAEKDIAKSHEDALEAIHNEMVDVALLASEEILKREVNKDDNSRLVDDFIKEMN